MFLESSEKIFQKISFTMCTLTQLQTQLYTLVSFGQTARNFTKASRMFESEF